MKRAHQKTFIIAIVIVLLVAFIYMQNNLIVTTHFEISSDRLPESFDGTRIVQLSDLHSKLFGSEQRRLVNKIKAADPDLIVFTGDLVDERRYDEAPSLLLMERLTEMAPVYFVTGNHEWRSRRFHSLGPALARTGVHILRDEFVMLESGSDQILLVGIDDPYYAAQHQQAYSETEIVEKSIQTALQETDTGDPYRILLSHRPEKMPVYTHFDFDLIFTGHAHGGQFRLPFIGGLAAPHQGFFPEYDSGQYTAEQSLMIVNRGLGNSIFPLRLFNYPEIVVVTLKSADK